MMASLSNAAAKRETLWHQQSGRCWICGEPMRKRADPDHPLAVTFDHLLPKGTGGTDRLTNLRLAHRKCNGERGMRPVEAVQSRLPARRPDRAAVVAAAIQRAVCR